MANRLYKAGPRPAQTKHYANRISKARYAWVKTVVGSIVLFRHPKEEIQDNEQDELIEESDVGYDPGDPGETILIAIPTKTRRAVVWNLTSLTHAELSVMREFFDIAFELAEPVCIERDKAANDAFESGDDTVTRIYRTFPELIVRDGAFAEYGQSLRIGSKAISSRRVLYELAKRGYLRSKGILREESGDLANADAQSNEPTDDGEAPN